MQREVFERAMALLPVCRAMTARGLGVDEALRTERLRLLAERAGPLEANATQIVEGIAPKLKETALFWKSKGRGAAKRAVFAFKPGSPRQVADALFNGLKLPRRACVDEEALQSLLALDTSGLVQALLTLRRLETMRRIYERLQPAADGRVRCVYNPAGTLSGRLSGAEAFYVPFSTNLMNLPNFTAARDPLFAVRDCIVPAPGNVLLYADLSQSEARITACLSDDRPLLAKWAQPGFDLHKHTASEIFHKSPGSITPRERYIGKKARHALNYGMGATTFARTVNGDADVTGVPITTAEAKRVRDAYHALHPRLHVWWAQVKERLERDGALTAAVSGWRCNFWPSEDQEDDVLKTAIAWEPQHTSVWILNGGLLEAFAREQECGLRVVSQQHDAVLAEAPLSQRFAAARLLKQALEREVLLNGHRLTIPVEVQAGARWGALERVL